MDTRVITGIGIAVALLILAGLAFAMCEYKQQQDLSHAVVGRWEHTNRDRVLTVTYVMDANQQEVRRWKIEKWDDVTRVWHDISHGTWDVRETGTFIFASELTSATFPVSIEGDTLTMENDKYKRVK